MYDVKALEEGTVINIVYDTSLLLPETRVVVLGTGGYEMASSVEDVLVKHKNIYSTLVSQPDNNPAKYTYLIFKDSAGKPHAAANAWIRSVSIIKNLTVQFKVTIDNRDEIDQITKALAVRGINNVAYDIIDNTAG